MERNSRGSLAEAQELDGAKKKRRTYSVAVHLGEWVDKFVRKS